MSGEERAQAGAGRVLPCVSAPLWEAFRAGAESQVLALLKSHPEWQHIDGDGSLRAACWYGMEGAARYLVRYCKAHVDVELLDIARQRGFDNMAGWLEDQLLIQAGNEMDKKQISFIP